MKPRLPALMTGTLIAVAALAACRREVPPPPTPVPDNPPAPKVQAVAVAWAAPLMARRLH